jgi:excisionase family DNA binding protein
MQEAPVLITEKEASYLLGCCERTVARMRERGEIRCVRLGSLVRYKRSEIDRFIDAQMEDTQPENGNGHE